MIPGRTYRLVLFCRVCRRTGTESLRFCYVAYTKLTGEKRNVMAQRSMEQEFGIADEGQGAPPHPLPPLLPPPILPPPGQPLFPPGPILPHQNLPHLPGPPRYPPHMAPYPPLPPPRGFFPRPHFMRPFRGRGEFESHYRGGRGRVGRGNNGRWKRHREWVSENSQTEYKRHRDDNRGASSSGGDIEAFYSKSMFEDPWSQLLSEEEARSHTEQLAAQIRERCGGRNVVMKHSSTCESKGDQDTSSVPQDPSAASSAKALDSSIDQTECDNKSVESNGDKSANSTQSVESSQPEHVTETLPACSETVSSPH